MDRLSLIDLIADRSASHDPCVVFGEINCATTSAPAIASSRKGPGLG